jgi:tetratricopeptide (TPR) repeat protein
MLETIREYALESLEQTGEIGEIRLRHARFFMELAEAAQAMYNGAQWREALEQLETEHDNFRAALTWSLSREGDAVCGLRLAGALNWFYYTRGHLEEGSRWLQRALEMSAPLGRTKWRARALHGLSRVLWRLGESAAARAPLDESVALWRELDDPVGLGHALTHLGYVAGCQGEVDIARSLIEEAISLLREQADTWALAMSLCMLGDWARAEGTEDANGARAAYEESIRLFRSLGNNWATALPLTGVGYLHWRYGELGMARARFEEGLALLRSLGDPWRSAQTLRALGDMAVAQGDLVRAQTVYQEALRLFRPVGARMATAWILQAQGAVARDRGDYVQACSLFEQSLTIQQERGDNQYTAGALDSLGYVAFLQGDLARASLLLEESLAVLGQSDHPLTRGRTLIHLAEVASARGDFPAAHTALEASLAIWRNLDYYETCLADCKERMARLARYEEDWERAEALYRETLAIRHKLGNRRGATTCLEGLASVAAAKSQPESAAQLFGAAEAQRLVMDTPLPPIEQICYQQNIDLLRTALGESPLASAWAVGRAMPLEQAVTLALETEPMVQTYTRTT